MIFHVIDQAITALVVELQAPDGIVSNHAVIKMVIKYLIIRLVFMTLLLLTL